MSYILFILDNMYFGLAKICVSGIGIWWDYIISVIENKNLSRNNNRKKKIKMANN